MVKSYDEIMELVGRTAEITNANSESTAVILTELKAQKSLLSGLSNTVEGIDKKTTAMGTEIEQLKMNEEITTTQQETIIELAKKRVLEIIGNEALEVQKYFRIFVQRLYRDTRLNAGLGSKVARTKKCDYQRCIDYIESWIPSCGCAALRTKADANAKARREARELGYINTKKANIKETVDSAITVSKINPIISTRDISISTDKISALNNLEKAQLWG